MAKITPNLSYTSEAEEAVRFYASIFPNSRVGRGTPRLDQSEIDRYWDTLLEGGSAEQCGWLKDKYGLSWQIVPTVRGQGMRCANSEVLYGWAM